MHLQDLDIHRHYFLCCFSLPIWMILPWRSPVLRHERDFHFVIGMDPLASIAPYAVLKKEKDLKKLYNSLSIGPTRFLRYEGRRTPKDKENLCREIITQNLQQHFSKFSTLSYTPGPSPFRKWLWRTSPISLIAVGKQSQSAAI